HHDAGGLVAGAVGDLAGQGEAVGGRHDRVEQGDGEGGAGRGGAVDLFYRLVGGGDHAGAHAPVGEHLAEDVAVGGVVIGDEHAQPVQAGGLDGAVPVLLPGEDGEGGGEVELAAAADLALDPHAPAHQLLQLRRDRQPQAGAAVPPRRRAVHLLERL